VVAAGRLPAEDVRSDRLQDLEIRDITFGDAPEWGLHMIGCEHVWSIT